MIFNRVLATLALLLSAFLTPWWLWFGLFLILAFVFGNFYEGVVVAFVYDLVFGGLPFSINLPFVFTIAAIVAVLIISPLRYRLWH